MDDNRALRVNSFLFFLKIGEGRADSAYLERAGQNGTAPPLCKALSSYRGAKA